MSTNWASVFEDEIVSAVLRRFGNPSDHLVERLDALHTQWRSLDKRLEDLELAMIRLTGADTKVEAKVEGLKEKIAFLEKANERFAYAVSIVNDRTECLLDDVDKIKYPPPKQKRPMSKEHKAKISASQKARHAARKATKKNSSK